jgi:uncharacterized protein YxeA
VVIIAICLVTVLIAGLIVFHNDRGNRNNLLQQAHLGANAVDTHHGQTFTGTNAEFASYKEFGDLLIMHKITAHKKAFAEIMIMGGTAAIMIAMLETNCSKCLYSMLIQILHPKYGLNIGSQYLRKSIYWLRAYTEKKWNSCSCRDFG